MAGILWAGAISLAFLMCLALTGCADEQGCRSTITGNDNLVTQACGGSGDNSAGTATTTPAPVIVPPVINVAPDGSATTVSPATKL